MNDPSIGLGAWALTFALHATAFALLAWIVERLPRMSDAVRESAWRLTLLGALVTASAQLTLGIVPWGGAWPTTFGAAAPAAPADVVAALAASPASVGGRLPSPAWPWLDLVSWVWVPWVWVLWVWAGLAALALLHLAGTYVRLRCRLRPVRLAPTLLPVAVPIAATLRLRRLPRLTTSAHTPTPLALGLLHPQICVPEWAMRELAPDELRATLAHEMAHVRRRDPAWALLYAVICRALFWHPVLWLARRRLLGLAETRCDAIAGATAPDAGLALARALLHVAEWMTPARADFGLAHGHAMAASLSGLQCRVRRLLAERQPRPLAARCVHVGILAVFGAAPFALPTVVESRPVTWRLDAAAALPAPLARLVRDVAALLDEVGALRELVTQAGLVDDPVVGDLLREIDQRTAALNTRCGDLVDRYRTDPLSVPLELR